MRHHFPVAVALVIAAGAAASFAQGPTPVIPAGFEGPGAYPGTVSGAVINMRNVAVPQEPDQSGEDNMFFEVPGSGPFYWTSSRNNGGDFGINISPFYGPMDARSYPSQPANNWAEVNGGTSYAWRVCYAKGSIFATPRSNGTAGRFVYNGTPITLYYTAAIGDGSTAQGYSMYSGFHTTEETSQTFGVDLLLGCAGMPDRQEAVGNVAVAYFPYEEGWVGGHFNYVTGDWQDSIAHSENLDPSVCTFEADASFRVDLPGIDSAADGILLVNGTQTNSNLKIIGAYPNAGGWTIFSREDDDTDTTGLTVPSDFGINFSFVYIPYTAGNLIGAQIDGTTGDSIHGAGTYTVSHLADGRYALTIPGKTDTSGALVLTSCGHMAGTDQLPDRTFFSYEYDAENSRFVIESREIIADSNTPWGRTPTLRDSDFYFVWVDFTNPLTPQGNACPPDWNHDMVLNSQDFFDFLNDFFMNDSDYNHDNVTNSQDFFDFLGDFFAGC